MAIFCFRAQIVIRFSFEQSAQKTPNLGIVVGDKDSFGHGHWFGRVG